MRKVLTVLLSALLLCMFGAVGIAAPSSSHTVALGWSERHGALRYSG